MLSPTTLSFKNLVTYKENLRLFCSDCFCSDCYPFVDNKLSPKVVTYSSMLFIFAILWAD